MDKILFKAIKEVSNKEISIKNNYKLFRIIENIMNKSIFNNNKYEDVVFNLKDREIKGRVFYPPSEKKGLVIFIHGGGWVSGSVESYTNTCIEMAKELKRTIISIDYRLAPEYPYPNGFNDCYETVKLIMDNLDKVGVKRKDVCLMGDSAGGNLVAAISIKAKIKREFRISKQILLYPALYLDYSKNTKHKSVIEKGKDYLLTQKQLQEYVALYVSDKKDLDSPFVSPLKGKFLFAQPDTLIITADHDPLKDEAKSYALKLKMHFNRVHLYTITGSIHGFFNSPLGKKHKENAYKKINKFLGDIDEDKN